MRGFLFDENLPRVPFLQTSLPVTHALDLGSQRIVLGVPPPRVVHLRVGNMRGHDFAAWLAHIWPQIESAIATHKLVNAYRDRIEAVN